MVLSRGNTLDYAEMYRGWAGHDPQIQPYLDYYGLERRCGASCRNLRQLCLRQRQRQCPHRQRRQKPERGE